MRGTRPESGYALDMSLQWTGRSCDVVGYRPGTECGHRLAAWQSAGYNGIIIRLVACSRRPRRSTVHGRLPAISDVQNFMTTTDRRTDGYRHRDRATADDLYSTGWPLDSTRRDSQAWKVEKGKEEHCREFFSLKFSPTFSSKVSKEPFTFALSATKRLFLRDSNALLQFLWCTLRATLRRSKL